MECADWQAGISPASGLRDWDQRVRNAHRHCHRDGGGCAPRTDRVRHASAVAATQRARGVSTPPQAGAGSAGPHPIRSAFGHSPPQVAPCFDARHRDDGRPGGALQTHLAVRRSESSLPCPNARFCERSGCTDRNRHRRTRSSSCPHPVRGTTRAHPIISGNACSCRQMT